MIYDDNWADPPGRGDRSGCRLNWCDRGVPFPLHVGVLNHRGSRRRSSPAPIPRSGGGHGDRGSCCVPVRGLAPSDLSPHDAHDRPDTALQARPEGWRCRQPTLTILTMWYREGLTKLFSIVLSSLVVLVLCQAQGGPPISALHVPDENDLPPDTCSPQQRFIERSGARGRPSTAAGWKDLGDGYMRRE
jgi:hypothetical protein